MKMNKCSYCRSYAVDIAETGGFAADKKEKEMWFVYCIDCSTSSDKQESREEVIIRWNTTFNKRRQYEDIF